MPDHVLERSLLDLSFPQPLRLNLALWWREAPHGALNAIMRANEAAPHLCEVARFLLPRLPPAVLASSTIKGAEGERASSRIIRLEQALAHRWISLNTTAWTNTETVDVDDDQWRPRLAAWLAMGGPAPAFIVISPAKGTAHLVWIYDRPIRHADVRQLRVRRGIKRGLAQHFGGDNRFANRLQKNPWARQADGSLFYETEIGDLRAVAVSELLTPLLQAADEQGTRLLGPKPVQLQGHALPIVIPGAFQGPDQKNGLFHAAADATRRARTADPTVISGIVTRTATAFGKPVSAGSQAEMVRSISAWMTTRWRGPLDGRPGEAGVGRRSVDVGVMTGEAADRGPVALAEWKTATVTEKREAAGRRSRAQVAEASDERIRTAFSALVAEGAAVTLDLVAERADVAPRTVKARATSLMVAISPLVEKVQHGLICSCGGSRQPAKPGVDLLAEESFLPSDTVPLGEAVRLVRATARRAAKREVATIAGYTTRAQRLAQRGAEPEPVLPPLSGSSLAVGAAYRAALAARTDAVRRHHAREQAQRGVRRAAERQTWHAAHAADEPAWAARLDDIAGRKSVAIERELRRDGDRFEDIDFRFGAIFAAEWRARRAAQGEPDPASRRRRHRLSAAELASIPW